MSETTGEGADATPAILVLAFDPPIKFNDKDYPEVILREPTTQQFADAQDFGGIRSTQHLIHVVGKLPKPVAGLIPISKTLEADRFFSRFVLPVPQT